MMPSTADSSFAQAPAAGTGAEGLGNPNILGDFLRIGSRSIGGSGPFSNVSSFNSNHLNLPVGGGPLKIAENENVRPQDRIFINYDSYSNIVPGANNSTGLSQINYQYQTLGFETTFLGGNASIGVRLAAFELNGKAFSEFSRFGDMSFVSKFLLAGDGAGGDCVSGGLVLTIPTGNEPFEHGHKIHSTVFQPWLGAMSNLSDDAYFQGFTSLALPSTRDDAVILFLDGAVGYWVYRGGDGGFLRGIVPTSELHINWPWTNRAEHDTTHVINVPSSVDLTEGVHLQFGRAWLQLGISFCVTGPRLYDFEGIAQFNLQF
jgi:hypothetical protein